MYLCSDVQFQAFRGSIDDLVEGKGQLFSLVPLQELETTGSSR